MNRRPVFRMPFVAAVLAILGWVGLVGLAEFGTAFIYGRMLTWAELMRFAGQCRPQLAGMWAVAAGAYAGVRVARCHPSIRAGYADWLAGTPWRAGRPLPLGPPYLVWEDAAFAAVVAVFAPMAEVAWVAFAAVYAVSAAYVAATGRDRRPVWAGLVALAGGVALAWPAPWALAMAGAMIVVADVGLRRSLRELPWLRPTAAAAKRDAVARAASGWMVAPVPPPEPIAVVDVVLLSAASAWATFCIVRRTVAYEPVVAGEAVALVAGVVAMKAVIRAGRYVGEHQPPISLWGRLWTGRLIVPGYDRALVAPAIGLVLGTAVPGLMYGAGAGAVVASTVGVGLAVPVLLAGGPTLARWQLTGHHRIVPRRRPPPRRRRTGTPPQA